ncbi:MAG: hypothetical protein AAGB00_03060 [Planctomycetota bacterium]
MSTPNNRVAAKTATAEPAINAYHAAGQPAADTPSVDFSQEATEASTPFIGRWRTLVSTTNWEKGRIITDWRASLAEAGASAAESSDEAWAQLVGGVTGQHVGRLRRVYARFGGVYAEYEGLYWSHFQAACEWDDAEMWLEGALQNGWSVSQVRAKRWEVVGADGPNTEAPAAGQDDVNEDFVADVSPAAEATAAAVSDGLQGEDGGGHDRSDSASSAERRQDETDDPGLAPTDSWPQPADAVRPFADLPELPDDVADAFEQFKLAILGHKLAGWAEIARGDLVGVLESLKQLALAPSQD